MIEIRRGNPHMEPDIQNNMTNWFQDDTQSLRAALPARLFGLTIAKVAGGATVGVRRLPGEAKFCLQQLKEM